MPIIPHVTMKSDVLAAALATMIRGNSLLRDWSDTLLGTKKRKVFRKLILSGNFNPADHGATPDQCLKFQADLPVMLAVKEVEFPICQHFGKMITKEAKRVGRREHQTYLEHDDFEMEAYQAVVDAVWGYSNSGTQFVTYVVWAIRNRFNTVIVNASPMSGVSSSTKLKEKFDAAKSALNRPSTWDEIVEEMGLTKKQRELLYAIQHRQYNLSDVPEYSSLDSNDYTALGKPLADMTQSDENNFIELVKKANLSPFEMAVVKAGAESTAPGWKAKVALENINPTTQKPYTRAAVKTILERAYKKITRLAA
jgi:DNA-directed RNA polymerase specialized sigma subunit